MSNLKTMEKDIVAELKRYYGRDLVSVIVEGSYAVYEHILGQSDYDTQIFIRNFKSGRKQPSPKALMEKYGVEISFSIKAYDDLKNRILNNNLSTRFVTNLSLLDYKLKARLLTGRDIIKDIPVVKDLLRRDLSSDLRQLYYQMTNSHPKWNIMLREPEEWAHSMINLAYGLVLMSGQSAKKKDLPILMKKLHPKCRCTVQLKKALNLRKTGKLRNLSNEERKTFRKDCLIFLEEMRQYLFFS